MQEKDHATNQIDHLRMIMMRGDGNLIFLFYLSSISKAKAPTLIIDAKKNQTETI